MIVKKPECCLYTFKSSNIFIFLTADSAWVGSLLHNRGQLIPNLFSRRPLFGRLDPYFLHEINTPPASRLPDPAFYFPDARSLQNLATALGAIGSISMIARVTVITRSTAGRELETRCPTFSPRSFRFRGRFHRVRHRLSAVAATHAIRQERSKSYAMPILRGRGRFPNNFIVRRPTKKIHAG